MARGALLVLLSMQVITALGNPIVLSMANRYKNEAYRPTMEEQMEIAMLNSQKEGQLSHPGSQNGNTRTELDIILTKEQVEESNGARKKRNAIRNTFYRWPNNVVPYQIDTSYFSSTEQQTIIDSINDWQAATCLTFRQRTSSDTDYVDVRQGDGGCYSYVGKIGGAQEMGLGPGCVYKEVVVHEFGHAIGLYHHQGRPDRDTYVDILLENISDGLESQFDKQTATRVNTFDVTYDYRSVMHYGRRFFSKNGQDTIRTKDSFYQDIIGRAPTLSFRDAKIVNAMFNCGTEAGCSTTPCPGEGYKGADCKCYCPQNDGVNIIECAEPATTPTTTTTTPTTTTTTTEENTTPFVEDTTPFVEDTTPFVEDTTPFVEDTTPFVEDTTPFVEDTTPFVEDTTPFVEDTTPFVEDTTPFVEDTTPFVEDTTPFVEDTTPFDEVTTEEPCGNIWANRRCRNLRRRGGCSRRRVKRNCSRTCRICGNSRNNVCSDKYPECPQLNFLCDSWTFLQNNCQLSCGTCPM